MVLRVAYCLRTEVGFNSHDSVTGNTLHNINIGSNPILATINAISFSVGQSKVLIISDTKAYGFKLLTIREYK